VDDRLSRLEISESHRELSWAEAVECYQQSHGSILRQTGNKRTISPFGTPSAIELHPMKRYGARRDKKSSTRARRIAAQHLQHCGGEHDHHWMDGERRQYRLGRPPPSCGWLASNGNNSLDLVGTGGIGGIRQPAARSILSATWRHPAEH
jgi:hypothetical protein